MNEQLLKEIARNLEKLVELKALELKGARGSESIVDCVLDQVDDKYSRIG